MKKNNNKTLNTKLRHFLKKPRPEATGTLNVKSTFNNTIINLADEKGNTLFIESTGSCGFKGGKKRTPFAAQVAAEKVRTFAYSKRIKNLNIKIGGPGKGRDSVLKTFKTRGFKILTITDTTPTPHNGCRPPKNRRT